ncbi:MAG: antitoxin Xre/MbcA/ParS toxin-binding domain-containing protein [Bermanella sp.]
MMGDLTKRLIATRQYAAYNEANRQNILRLIVMTATEQVFSPKAQRGKTVSGRVMTKVGKMVGSPLKGSTGLVHLTRKGIDPIAYTNLMERGFKHRELNWIIPGRTLRHRLEKHQLLNQDETGRLLRAAKIFAMAEEVFGSNDLAMKWLHKPRKAFDDMSAMEFIKTEAGAILVEEMLGQIDSGYFA